MYEPSSHLRPFVDVTAGMRGVDVALKKTGQ
jgi:hypothetical protein